MPRLTNAVPALRKHKASGQAVVCINGVDRYLGPHGTKASRNAYDRAIGEWLQAGRGVKRSPAGRGPDTTVRELLAGFWKHAQTFYASPNGHTGELGSYKLIMRVLKRLYGPTTAAEFGPLAMKAVMGECVKIGWSRKYINSQMGRLKRVFKWGVGCELIPGDVLHGLAAVDGLRRGKCDARETEPVQPVSMELVQPVLAIAPPPLAAMISVQILTGMRPGEVCQMRPMDLDRSCDPWMYTPATHKTQHHGHAKSVPIGEKCQAVIRPFLDRAPDAHLFSQAESIAWTRAQRTLNRKTPLSCGNRVGTHVAKRPKLAPSATRYTTASYGKAIDNLADRAFPPPAPLAKLTTENEAGWAARLTAEQRVELAAWRKAHRWHPHQLRHNLATTVRKEFGVEAAQLLLGHRNIKVTELYAERNMAKAIEIVKQIG